MAFFFRNQYNVLSSYRPIFESSTYLRDATRTNFHIYVFTRAGDTRYENEHCVSCTQSWKSKCSAKFLFFWSTLCYMKARKGLYGSKKVSLLISFRYFYIYSLHFPRIAHFILVPRVSYPRES